VLEGVAAGCQVVCSDIPAFRDLARYFPRQVSVARRGDLAAIAAAVRSAQRRTRAARPDIGAFTWDAVTERVLDVYRRVTGVVQDTVDADGQRVLAEG
jgi:glycosyltransferase involved in cell wall biosynthesis